jgi:hypothetical protein
MFPIVIDFTYFSVCHNASVLRCGSSYVNETSDNANTNLISSGQTVIIWLGMNLSTCDEAGNCQILKMTWSNTSSH